MSFLYYCFLREWKQEDEIENMGYQGRSGFVRNRADEGHESVL